MQPVPLATSSLVYQVSNVFQCDSFQESCGCLSFNWRTGLLSAGVEASGLFMWVHTQAWPYLTSLSFSCPTGVYQASWLCPQQVLPDHPCEAHHRGQGPRSGDKASSTGGAAKRNLFVTPELGYEAKKVHTASQSQPCPVGVAFIVLSELLVTLMFLKFLLSDCYAMKLRPLKCVISWVYMYHEYKYRQPSWKQSPHPKIKPFADITAFHFSHPELDSASTLLSVSAKSILDIAYQWNHMWALFYLMSFTE